MPCSVTESVRTVSLNQVETGDLDPKSAAYPFPTLSLSNQFVEVSIPVLILENDLIRAEIAPTLGGRLLKIERKNGISGSITCKLEAGGKRGVASPFGTQITLDGSERLDALATLEATMRVADEEDGAEVLLTSTSWPISFHARYEILDDRAEVALEVKTFNRSLSPVHYDGGLIKNDPCAGVFSEDLFADTRFGRLRSMAPHQLDTWRASIAPLDKDQDPLLLAEGLSVKFLPEGLVFQGSRWMEGLKVVVLTKSQETLEATITVGPDEPISIPLSVEYLPIARLVILDSDRKEVLQWPSERLSPAQLPNELLEVVPKLEQRPKDLKDAAFKMKDRSLAHLLLGYQGLKRGDWSGADFQFEQSLLFNGEDHLAWWFKAYSARMLDPEGDHSAEILNAHFLAPLEPALRVEAFLAQSIQGGKAMNPILAPLADRSDDVMDVASHLIEAGLFQDAAKLLSEILRGADFPMFRYLLAYCYLEGSRMTMEAAGELRKAAATSFTAPFPHRPIEVRALNSLHAKWPEDILLSQYMALV